jgi:hypothetical protein
MDFHEFQRSVSHAAPPTELSSALQALWWDAKGDWHRAHDCAQAQPDQAGAWVHAYLHRKEGDEANAGYWYRRAGRQAGTGPLEDEWAAIARDLARIA